MPGLNSKRFLITRSGLQSLIQKDFFYCTVKIYMVSFPIHGISHFSLGKLWITEFNLKRFWCKLPYLIGKTESSQNHMDLSKLKTAIH